jgi:septum formation protein
MGKKQAFRLILASASPARRELLAQAGYVFEVRPADIAEPSGAGFTDARAFVAQVAWLKAAAVAQAVTAESDAGQTIVLAADTVGWLGGQAIGKPSDEGDARRILMMLGDTEHELWTGVCLWRCPDHVQFAWQECSRVAMKKLSLAEIDEYLRTREWQGCSGAYAIQEGDDPYVRIVSGSRTNVIGLPMETLERVLRSAASV